MISTRKRPSTRHTDPKTVAEVYIGWYDMTTRRKWRWDVTFYETTDAAGPGPRTKTTPFPGVYSCRRHLSAESGYALTERGGWRKIRRAIRRYQRWVG